MGLDADVSRGALLPGMRRSVERMMRIAFCLPCAAPTPTATCVSARRSTHACKPATHAQHARSLPSLRYTLTQTLTPPPLPTTHTTHSAKPYFLPPLRSQASKQPSNHGGRRRDRDLCLLGGHQPAPVPHHQHLLLQQGDLPPRAYQVCSFLPPSLCAALPPSLLLAFRPSRQNFARQAPCMPRGLVRHLPSSLPPSLPRGARARGFILTHPSLPPLPRPSNPPSRTRPSC